MALKQTPQRSFAQIRLAGERRNGHTAPAALDARDRLDDAVVKTRGFGARFDISRKRPARPASGAPLAPESCSAPSGVQSAGQASALSPRSAAKPGLRLTPQRRVRPLSARFWRRSSAARRRKRRRTLRSKPERCRCSRRGRCEPDARRGPSTRQAPATHRSRLRGGGNAAMRALSLHGSRSTLP